MVQVRQHVPCDPEHKQKKMKTNEDEAADKGTD